MRDNRMRIIRALFSFLMAGALVLTAVPAYAEAGEGGFEAVSASSAKVSGRFVSDFAMELTGRYNAGAMNPDGGSAEIVAYDAEAGAMYAVNGIKGTLDRVPMSSLADGADTVIGLAGTEIDVAAMLTSVGGFEYGDMTSVAVNGGLVAVAVQAAGYAERGKVAVFETMDDGLQKLALTFNTGVQPDMLTFTPDGGKILVANEGEPRMGVEGADPAGSVTIVTLDRADLMNSFARTAGFEAFDARRAALTANNVVLRKDVKPSVDFEPEYVVASADGSTAYVALQEANSIATLDLESAAFTAVDGLGVKNYGAASGLDLLDDGEIDIKAQPDVYGLYLPDGIALHEAGGKTYILTANEGDSRADWEGLDDEVESEKSPTGNVTMPEEVVWYNAALHEGLDQSKAYLFGGRSFAIWEMTASGLRRVYDSGDDFETLTAKVLPAYFNCSNDDISLDDRSGKKGVEPEYVTTGVVDGKTYAFIGLERVGGVMAYDISDIQDVTFANYINSREFGADVQGDVAPEGLCFIPAEQSLTGSAQLLAACEVSGTVAVYEMK